MCFAIAYAVCQLRRYCTPYLSLSSLNTGACTILKTAVDHLSACLQALSAAAQDDRDRVCIIGAGKSGLIACKVLHQRGVTFDCFETGSQVCSHIHGAC